VKLHDIARLYRVRLKERSILAQEGMAVLGISIGVALLFASQIASTSLNGSAQRVTDGIVGQAQYQLKSRSTQGFDERVLGEVQRLPGVQAAVPVLEQEVGVIGPRGRLPVDLLATDPRSVQLAGGLLTGFTPQRLKRRLLPLLRDLMRTGSREARLLAPGRLLTQRLLVLPAPVAGSIGAGRLGLIAVQIGARIVPAVLATEASSSQLGPLSGSPVAAAPLAYAQQLTGMQGKITRILVRARPGEQLQARTGLLRLAGGRLNVEPADFDATLFRQAATPVNQSTDTFAAVCALVGFMLAYCAMLMSTPTRRRLARELHLAGATRREILRALLFDALALGAVGSLVGLALGDLLSVLVFSSSPGFLSVAFPVGSQRIVTWESVLYAVVAGLLSACVGVLVPSRDAWRARRREFATHARLSQGMLLAGVHGVGLACLGATTAVLLAAPGSAIVGIATLVFALLLLLPSSIAAILTAFERAQRALGSRATAIAILELRAPAVRIRSIAIAATAAIAVFGSVTIEGSRANLEAGLERSFHSVTSVADLWIVPSGSQSLVGAAPFEGPAAARLADLPGIRAVGIYRSSFLEVGDRRVWVLAPASTAAQPLARSQLVQGDIARANTRLREGGWAVISKTLAARLGLRIGQSFSLPSPNPIRLRVAALSTNLGWSPGAVVLSPQDYVGAWGNADPTAYNVILSPGASPIAVKRELSRLLSGAGLAGLKVQTAAERERSQTATARQGLTRLTQMALLALIAGILATAASVAAVVSQRRRQLAHLRVQGFSRRLLWAALVWEGALLIGAGCLIGALFGIYGQLLLSHALIAVTGFPVVLSARIGFALESLAVVTLAAATVIAIPGYRAAGARPQPYS
jgi:putative ABC transport system permease protein